MKVTLDTKVLKGLVARVMKGVGNNESVMRTCWIGIKCANNTLGMIAWDGENYLEVREEKIVCDDFKVTVTANTFAQLINKTTSETVTLELKENYLQVKGNGTYKLELPVNEDGDLDVYPELNFDYNKATEGKIKLSSISWAIEGNKISLAKTPENPHLMCYYFGTDSILTTDNTTASKADIGVFEEALLLKAELVNLVNTMENEQISVFIDGNRILFQTPKTIILGYCNEGLEQYDELAPDLKTLFEDNCPASCVVDSAKLLGILDRIMLFVKTKEEGIRVMFTDKGIQFYNKADSVNELLAYEESSNFTPCEVKLQLDILKDLVNSVCADKCYIQYGADGFLKFGREKRHHLLTVLAEEE